MLLDAAPTGVETDLAQINRRYRPALMSFFLRRLRNHAEAEDCTQEVFARLAGIDATRMASASAYIFQVAANLLRDRGRREKVRHEFAVEQEAEAVEVGVETLDPARIVSGRQSLRHVAARLKELPERTRAIFVLYRLENMSKQEIAQAYGVSMSTVEKSVAKALAHLMQAHEETP